MLIELRVRDLGVIEDLGVVFGPGMTALTGETGAGKTLLVEALTARPRGSGGGRSRPGRCRRGDGRGTFRRAGGSTAPTTRRSSLAGLPASGRSRACVDGRMAPVSALADAGPELVDIHGQHDQQSLVAPPRNARPSTSSPAWISTRCHGARRGAGDWRGGWRPWEAMQPRGPGRLDVLRHQLAEIEGAGLDDPEEEQAWRPRRSGWPTSPPCARRRPPPWPRWRERRQRTGRRRSGT